MIKKLVQILLHQSLKNTFWHLPKAFLCSLYYGFPQNKLTLIGVTGTDGKTSTATYIYHLLRSQGIKTGLLSTISTKLGDEEVPSALHTTSPDPRQTLKMLKKMIRSGLTHAVIETTSIGLHQHRFAFFHFDVGIFLNLTHEHLDYHPDMDHYLKAKSILLKNSKVSILNQDDPATPILKKVISSKIITYSIKQPSDYQAQKIKQSLKNIRFYVPKLGDLVISTPYRYQIYNLLASVIAAKVLGVKDENIKKLLRNLPPVPGRREEFKNKHQVRVIIDFAHTPHGLSETLSDLKRQTKKNLIVVYGATGERDRAKRPIMGKIVAQTANISVITADDPRRENMDQINQAIAQGYQDTLAKYISPRNKKLKKLVKGANQKPLYFIINNRQSAINFAVTKLIGPGDTLLLAGKGHEKSITYGKVEYPWSEADALRSAFRLKKITS
jgi:UDP-N-acetylmuramoyl-L-alanyl-D-glutamate--2,6-diaminopimelate ligase